MMLIYKQSDLRSKENEAAVEAAEAEINKYIGNDGLNKINEEIMFAVAPGDAVKSFKRNSTSYDAAKNIYTAFRKKERQPTKEEQQALAEEVAR